MLRPDRSQPRLECAYAAVVCGDAAVDLQASASPAGKGHILAALNLQDAERHCCSSEPLCSYCSHVPQVMVGHLPQESYHNTSPALLRILPSGGLQQRCTDLEGVRILWRLFRV